MRLAGRLCGLTRITPRADAWAKKPRRIDLADYLKREGHRGDPTDAALKLVMARIAKTWQRKLLNFLRYDRKYKRKGLLMQLGNKR